MRAMRPIIRHPKVQDALCWIVASYVRLVKWTGRWQIVGDDTLAGYVSSDRPFIVAFWHGRLLMMPFAYERNRPVDILISNHPDGRLIAKTIGHLGVGTIVGSTSRGGANAARQLTRRLKRENGIVGITPDGPRGPRMRASEGVVALARLAGVPIFTVAYSTSSGKILNSWDRFLLPYPFCRGVFMWSDPIDVPRDANKAILENKRIEVENSLNLAVRRCDEMMGRPTVEPAPAVELVPATAER